MTGLLDVARQAEQAQLARDASMSRHGLLSDDHPLQRAQYGSMYGSLMQDPADKARMERQMMEDTLAMMPMAGMTTYHGSPHIFNKFRMDRIGTGEGAQAYGHGLYLAENPHVAKEYRDALSKEILVDGKKVSNLTSDPTEKALLDAGFDANKAIGKLESKSYKSKILNDAKQKVINKIKDLRDRDAIKYPQGNLYKVDLPDEQIAKMLDWDKPLSEQPENFKKIKGALEGQGIDIEGWMQTYVGRGWKEATGENVYRALENAVLGTKMDSSMFLKGTGIPGIKYLDQGSRGAGQGTRNFVVFDENIPQILERNQQPIGGLLGK